MTHRTLRRAAAAALLLLAAVPAVSSAIVGSEKSLAYVAAVSLVVIVPEDLVPAPNSLRAALEADAATKLAGQGVPVVPIDDLATRKAGLLTLMVSGSPLDNAVLYAAELFLEQPVIPVYAQGSPDFLFAVTWVQGQAGSAPIDNAATRIRAIGVELVDRFLRAYEENHAPPKAGEADARPKPKATPK